MKIKTLHHTKQTSLWLGSYLPLQLPLTSLLFLEQEIFTSLPHTWCVLSHPRAFAPALPSPHGNLQLIFAYLTNTHLLDLSRSVFSSRKLSLASLLRCPIISSQESILYLSVAIFLSPPQAVRSMSMAGFAQYFFPVPITVRKTL